ncbi:glucokinase [Pilimelia anulata]|uniref:Glucokinase n=1 Tax=Pilimelia anulata TaxID=53371 RepID=A0A8J3FCT0_9ACTN|nr:ROK family protein [Pilimelia anulata]GGK07602.1 glucokinase [Pilimelia anulata]
MPDPRTAIGLDIGGTKIAAGVVDAAGALADVRTVPMPRDADAAVAAILGLAGEVRAAHPGVAAVGAGAAGLVRQPDGFISRAPNSPYHDLPLQALLAQRLGLPAVVDNDANAAAWAEYKLGAGVGHTDVVVLTVGTGIGGGIVVGGGLLRGSGGLAAEVGHLRVRPGDGARCGCGAIGCLEAEASGTALGRLADELAAKAPDSPMAALAGPDGVPGEAVHRAAAAGEPSARALFGTIGDWLGVGMAALVTVFDPSVVIVGGGLVRTGDLLLDPARASLRRNVFGADARPLPPVVPARLGPEAGLVGAGLLALDAAERVRPPRPTPPLPRQAAEPVTDR